MQSDGTKAGRLVRAVIVKAFIEILLVCLVATLVAFTTFNPQLRGAVDMAGPDRLAGWAHDPRSPDESIEVQLFLDGQFAATARADGERADLVAAGATATSRHGFAFDLAPLQLSPGRHVAQVFALRPAVGGRMLLLPITRHPVLLEVGK